MKINRKEIYDKLNGHCAYCGCEITIKEMQVDHIYPQFLAHHFRGNDGCIKDVHAIINLNPSCRVCNKWKSTWTIEEFRHEIKMQIQRLRQYSASFRLSERFGLISFNEGEIVFYFEKASLPPTY